MQPRQRRHSQPQLGAPRPSPHRVSPEGAPYLSHFNGGFQPLDRGPWPSPRSVITPHALQRTSRAHKQKEAATRACCNATLAAYAHAQPRAQAERAKQLLDNMQQCDFDKLDLQLHACQKQGRQCIRLI